MIRHWFHNMLIGKLIQVFIDAVHFQFNVTALD